MLFYFQTRPCRKVRLLLRVFIFNYECMHVKILVVYINGSVKKAHLVCGDFVP